MYGDGDLEWTQNGAGSESGQASGMEKGTSVPLNLYESSKLTFSDTTPLVA